MSNTTTTLTTPIDDAPVAGASTTPLCVLCNIQSSIYTCPRCHFKSCSLKCSTAHKALTVPPCSGERDRTAYVPLNQYGYGKMVDDYVFLEDVGRKVEEWGRGIVRDRIATKGTATQVGRPMRGGRGRGRGRGYGTKPAADRKSFLSMQLGFRDVDMDVLPDGMERHRLNNSVWDTKKQTALLTIELVFHANLTSYPHAKTPFRLMTHKNDWNCSLREIIHGQLKAALRSRKDELLVQWIDALTGVDEGEDGPLPLCVIKQPKPVDLTAHPSSQTPYYKLDWAKPLSKALKSTHFVEFPTIEVMEEAQFSGILVDGEGTKNCLGSSTSRKRRKVDASAGKKAITTLVGGYGSEESFDGESNHEQNTTSPAGVVDYDSDDIEASGEDADAEGDIDEMADEDNFREILADVGPDVALDIPVVDEEEDDLDWGDSDDDADLEAKAQAAISRAPESIPTVPIARASNIE